MAKKKAPFTEEEVKALQEWQILGLHSFTCCSYEGCIRTQQPNDGALIPSKDGWICPCGKWKQDWCHDYMLQSIKGGAICWVWGGIGITSKENIPTDPQF